MKNIFIAYGISGSGKTTLGDKTSTILFENIKKNKRFIPNKENYLHSVFYTSISTTTRESRFDEIHGIDYYFVSKEEFKSLNMLEFTFFNDNFYGTQMSEIMVDSENIFMVLEIEGINSIVKYVEENNLDFNIYTVFMNIDKNTIISNLIKDGYSEEEAIKRYNRGTILEDRKKLSIPDTLEINSFDNSTELFLNLLAEKSNTVKTILKK